MSLCPGKQGGKAEKPPCAHILRRREADTDQGRKATLSVGPWEGGRDGILPRARTHGGLRPRVYFAWRSEARLNGSAVNSRQKHLRGRGGCFGPFKHAVATQVGRPAGQLGTWSRSSRRLGSVLLPVLLVTGSPSLVLRGCVECILVYPPPVTVPDSVRLLN